MAAAAGGVEAAELVDLLADRIDALELTAGKEARPTLTPDDSLALQSTLAALQSRLGVLPSDADRQSHLLSLVQSLYESDYHARHALTRCRERLDRQTSHKSKLEALCRELSAKNAQLRVEVARAVESGEHAAQALRSKFETSLTSIQQQIGAQAAEREAQAQAQNALKSHLEKLIALDATRESHHAKVVEAKEIEAKILQTELVQLGRARAQAERVGEERQARLDQLAEHNAQLTAQLAQYSSKFQEIEGLLTSNHNVFASMKAELASLQTAQLKAEKAKLGEMEKNRENHAVILRLLEDKKESEAKFLKSEKQRLLMQNLNGELSKQMKQMKALKARHDSSSTSSSGGSDSTCAADSGVGGEVSAASGESSVIESQPSAG